MADAVPVSTVARSARPERVVLAVLLAATAALYLLGLDRSGYANTFYAAAAQAGSVSWKAFFYGSSDAASSITVDKPPASLWLMALSVRVFGLSPWSILVPEALTGVASVAVLRATVRRTSGPAAALVAGAVLALTPVAALVFRFDNPDALLVLLTVAAAWTLLRAVDDGRTRWLLATGVLLGLGFLTKQLQVFLVVPALAVTYLVAGPVRLRRRLGQLVGGGVALLLAAGWWVAVVSLVPAADRPWVGGSPDNSVLGLTFGYNGLDRLLGHGRATGAGAFSGLAGAGGAAGPLRLLTGENGAQIAWLLPTALVLGVAAVVLRGRAPRTDPQRAAHLLWLVWALTGTAVFSLMSGAFHEYYTVALAPAVGALVGGAGVALWRERARGWVRAVLALVVLGTAGWSWVLLGRSASFVPPLRWTVLVVAVLVVLGFVGARWLPRRAPAVLAVGAVLVGLAGPGAYAVETADTPHAGSTPTAGPALGPARTGDGFGARSGGQGPASVPAQVVAELADGAGAYTWVAATVGSDEAAGYQLATGDPVMPLGGFSGSDPSPTLAQFQAEVAAGRIHYFVSGGLSGLVAALGGAGRPSGQISAWVSSRFTAHTVDGVTVYDLTAPTG